MTFGNKNLSILIYIIFCRKMDLINDFFYNDVGKKTSHYLISGLSLVTALSFNDLITKTISKYYPLQSDALLAKAIYCISLVIILILLIKFLPNTVSEIPQKNRELFGLVDPDDYKNEINKNKLKQ